MSDPVTVDEALQHIHRARPAPGAETLPLDACLGRILRKPVIARTTLPPSAVSAMDGYAVRFADVQETGTRLTVIGEAPAGQPFECAIGPGEAVRIFTGGALPSGADHVLIQEHAVREDKRVTVSTPQSRPRHIRRKGLDFSAGDTVLHAGVTLGPAELAMAAAANHASLEVTIRPKVAIITSGSELRAPGSPLGPGDVVNSNATAIAALVRLWGGEPIDAGLAPDRIDAIREHVERSVRSCDIIVAIGGASVGDHDLMRAAFRELGAQMVFEKVAVRPGKPTWHARLGRTPVLGLPGNPATAYVCAHLFLAPMLDAGGGMPRLVKARITHDLPANGAREAYIRARLSGSVDGRTVTALDQQDTALIHPFLEANCLIRRRPGDPACIEEDIVECLSLAARTSPH